MPFLAEFERKLDLPLAEKTQVVREMRSHCEELTEDLMASGMDAAAAEQEATRRLGDPRDVASRLRTVHCRATWRTAMLMVLPFLPAILTCFIGLPLRMETSGSPSSVTSGPHYALARIGSLAIASCFGVLMAAASARELRRGGRPAWLATWMGVGLWLFISIPWLLPSAYAGGPGRLEIMHAEVPFETLALGIIAAWMSARWRIPLAVLTIFALAGLSRMPWDMPQFMVIMLCQSPFIVVIGRKVFGSHPYGNGAQTSLFLFAFCQSAVSHVVTRTAWVDLSLPLMASIAAIATVFVYARASTWTYKLFALSAGVVMASALSGLSTGMRMSLRDVSSVSEFVSEPAIEMTLLLCWVILIPMLLDHWESRRRTEDEYCEPIASKEGKAMPRLPRWLRRLLITAGILVMLNFIGAMVMDHHFFHTKMLEGGALGIARHPEPTDYFSGRKLTTLPSHVPGRDSAWEMELISCDLSALDVTGRENDLLLHATFDNKTKWPAGMKSLPLFKPERIMELGKNPGLGVRSLHKQGITGKGVGIAIIDYALLVDHDEYKDRLRMYEEIHSEGTQAHMHGCATASIAVGKTAGVAPGADLYFISVGNMRLTPLLLAGVFLTRGRSNAAASAVDFGPVARAIDRVVAVNRLLPRDRKIRVISISMGWEPGLRGVPALLSAISRAEKEGIFVVTVSLDVTSGGKMSFRGLGRDPLLDPNAPTSYSPALPGRYKVFDLRPTRGPTLLIPMDSRCTAGPVGTDDYVFYRRGGISWSVPYVAGLYALACQVKPGVTPEEFWKTAMETGDTVHSEHGGTKFTLDRVVNPVKLIARLGAGRGGIDK